MVLLMGVAEAESDEEAEEEVEEEQKVVPEKRANVALAAKKVSVFLKSTQCLIALLFRFMLFRSHEESMS